MNYLTDRKRALGLGSGRQGTHHHWQMMISSIALVFIIPLFVLTFGIGLGGTYEEVLAYFGRPFPAIVMALTLTVVLNHVMQEALVAIEDYMHGVAQLLTLIAVRGITYTLMLAGLFAVARLAL